MPPKKRPHKATRKAPSPRLKKPKTVIGNTDSRLAYKPREVAVLLGLDPSTVYGIIRSGALAYRRLPNNGRMIVSRQAVLDYLDENAAS